MLIGTITSLDDNEIESNAFIDSTVVYLKLLETRRTYYDYSYFTFDFDIIRSKFIIRCNGI